MQLRHVFQSVNFFTGIFEWSVDLDDCDKILRIVCGNDISLELVKTLKSGGVNSLVLEIFDENGISII